MFAKPASSPLVWVVWALLCLLAWLAYRPGLTGGFLFDDFVNLDALGRTGPVDDWPTFWRYITSGTADPLGRPVALLTFLFDAQDWPASPGPFLKTNLWLHVLNGTTLFFLIWKLQLIAAKDSKAGLIAALAAGMWMLHPLFVSTTLYVVQRESMLAATFVFAGLLFYVQGRHRLTISAGTQGIPQMIAGLTVFTALAAFSKANGVLLPVLAGVLELTVLRSSGPMAPRATRKFRIACAVLIALPALAIGAYLFRQALNWNLELPMRPWTTADRLMTQPRVLMDYLQLLVVPRSVSAGLYNEHFAVSTSWLNPATTLPFAMIIAGLVFAGFRWRTTKPVLAASILFFFAGHLLESTAIPLELYFEHRNYLPAALLAWPLAVWIVSSRCAALLRGVVACSAFALLAITTYHRADIWGKPSLLSSLWASQNLDSSRAQATAAINDIRSGRPERAMARLKPLWNDSPDDLQISLNYINATCAAGRLSREDADKLSRTLERAQIGTLLVRQWLEAALDTAARGRCPGLDLPILKAWLTSAQRNPAINTPLAREKSFPPLLALVALHEQKPELALSYFDRALTANISPETAAGQAARLASSGYYRQALDHLETYERLKGGASRPSAGMPAIHAQVLELQQYWPRELNALRHKLKQELLTPQGNEQ